MRNTAIDSIGQNITDRGLARSLMGCAERLGPDGEETYHGLFAAVDVLTAYDMFNRAPSVKAAFQEEVVRKAVSFIEAGREYVAVPDRENPRISDVNAKLNRLIKIDSYEAIFEPDKPIRAGNFGYMLKVENEIKTAGEELGRNGIILAGTSSVICKRAERYTGLALCLGIKCMKFFNSTGDRNSALECVHCVMCSVQRPFIYSITARLVKYMKRIDKKKMHWTYQMQMELDALLQNIAESSMCNILKKDLQPRLWDDLLRLF